MASLVVHLHRPACRRLTPLAVQEYRAWGRQYDYGSRCPNYRPLYDLTEGARLGGFLGAPRRRG